MNEMYGRSFHHPRWDEPVAVEVANFPANVVVMFEQSNFAIVLSRSRRRAVGGNLIHVVAERGDCADSRYHDAFYRNG